MAATATSFRSLNGAHRFAVCLPDGTDAVYIPRRDTNSRLNTLIGGRWFPGPHHLAAMTMRQAGECFDAELSSHDGSTHVTAAASSASHLPEASVFDGLDHASDFFEHGSIGYSDHPDRGCYEGLELHADNWSVTPVHVEHVESSFFDDRTRFPDGSVVLDHALLMRDVRHTWRTSAPLHRDGSSG